MSISATASAHDLRALLDVVAALEDNAPEDGLPRAVLTNLAELIDCDQLTFYELDSAARTIVFDQGLVDDDTDDLVFWTHYSDCLACCYPDVSGDFRSVTMLSDFYSKRDLQRVGMYVEYLRPAGTEHEMLMCLPVGPRRTLRLAFFRGPGPDFTDAERAVLSLLRPHLRAHLDQQQRRKMPYLTQRQRQLLELVAGGHTNIQIARRLAISEGTVRKHMENIFDRLGVTSRAAAVTKALGQLTS